MVTSALHFSRTYPDVCVINLQVTFADFEYVFFSECLNNKNILQVRKLTYLKVFFLFLFEGVKWWHLLFILVARIPMFVSLICRLRLLILNMCFFSECLNNKNIIQVRK
jgi:hypothetical protein